MSNILENLREGRDLSFEESKVLFNELMEGKYDENSIIEILESLIKKGETKNNCIKKKTNVLFFFFFLFYNDDFIKINIFFVGWRV